MRRLEAKERCDGLRRRLRGRRVRVAVGFICLVARALPLLSHGPFDWMWAIKPRKAPTGGISVRRQRSRAVDEQQSPPVCFGGH